MSGPNHLWSGDWERESTRAGERRAAIPQPVEPEPLQPELEINEATPPWRRRTTLYAALAIVTALVVGAALALTLTGNSPKQDARQQRQPTTTNPQAPATGPSGGAPVQAAPTTSGPTANWLGMQIVTSPSGAVVSTVSLGSPGDVAGFEPGDVLDTIDGKQINSARQIRSSTAGLPLGSKVQVEINRGSTVITVLFTMRDRPTIQP